jgi:hypothetical protein
MPMLKLLPSITVGSTGAGTAVELGETPFFPGGNALMHFTAPPAGAVVLAVQGSADGTTGWSTIQTFNAAAMAGGVVEITDLPKFIRTNITTAGTAATVGVALEGVQ